MSGLAKVILWVIVGVIVLVAVVIALNWPVDVETPELDMAPTEQMNP